jgi:hypothetical protein
MERIQGEEFDGVKALLAVATWKGRFFVHVSRCEAMGAVRFRVSVSVSPGGPS